MIMKKRLVSLALGLIIILSFIPSSSAETREMYSCDKFISLFQLDSMMVLAAGSTIYDKMDVETLTHYLFLDPKTSETEGLTIYYYTPDEGRPIVFSAQYADQINIDKNAEKLSVSFYRPVEMTMEDARFIVGIIETILIDTIHGLDQTETEEITNFFYDFKRGESYNVPSMMKLKGGYWLTASFDENSWSFEISKYASSQNDMIYCPECGQQIVATSKFCMYCGFKIPSVSAPASKTPQPTKTPAPVTKTWSSWSSWSTTPAYSSSTREVETRTTIKGYNMFHYRTQYRDAPYPRVFRDYSINGDFDWKYSRRSYGEKYLEKYVTADQLAAATIYSPDSRNVYNGKHPGYQDGTTIAYGFKDDEFMWFIRSKDTVTEYRYRDLK